MKKIQAKKKRDRAENDAEGALQAAPENGQQARSLLDDEDDTPVLFA